MSTVVVVAYATRTFDLRWVPDDATVVVVHNDDTFDRASVTRDIVHVDAPGNVGFGAAVNLALPHVTGRRLLLCNPDLALSGEHWTALDAPDDDTVVTVPLVDPDGGPTSVSSRYPTPWSHLASGYRVGRWFPRGSPARQRLARLLGRWGRAHEESLASPAGSWLLTARWLSGAALSVPNDRFRAVGGFDETYFLYYEDVDLCRRLARRFPTMRAIVADVTPGVHAVGGSAPDGSTAVERLRLDAAVHYAESNPGASWSLCAALLRARRRWLR